MSWILDLGTTTNPRLSFLEVKMKVFLCARAYQVQIFITPGHERKTESRKIKGLLFVSFPREKTLDYRVEMKAGKENT